MKFNWKILLIGLLGATLEILPVVLQPAKPVKGKKLPPRSTVQSRKRKTRGATL